MLLNAYKDIGLAVNTGKTEYMEIGHHRSMIANEHMKLSSNSYEKVKTFKYLGCLVTKAGNSCYSVQTLFFLNFSLRI